MATSLSNWIALSTLVTSFITYLEVKKTNKTVEAMEALGLVIEASEKTQTYLQRRSKCVDRDPSIESELAEIWSKAAFLISRINTDLSIRLNAKSEFWRNPDTWNTDLRAHKDISLDSIKKDSKRLMRSFS